jgi:hypothetical protein
MARQIEVVVSRTGEIEIDAVGFKGADCEKATAFLETALGKAGKKVKKPEYYASARTSSKQKVGG